LAVDVALASAAAPSFFPAASTGTQDPRSYVDGGVWANNPSLVAVRVAHEFLQIPFEQIRLISIGNGEVPDGVFGVNFNATRRMQMLYPILDMISATQMESADRVCGMLLKDERWTGARMLRVNVGLPRNIPLDDVDQALKILPPRAVTQARNESDRFRSLLVR